MRRITIASILILLIGFGGWADYSDFTFRIQGLFDGLQDPNTGLTVFPTLLVPLGGKLEGMGTAYSAVAGDSGFLDANPAASSILTYSELSFLHHNWIADSNLEGVIYTVRINDFGLGAGGKFLYVPFTGYNDYGLRTSKGIISESVAIFNVSYNLFSSYDFYGLALGGNLKIAYRSVPAAIYPDQSAVTGMMDFGLLTRFNFLKFYYARAKNVSFGMVVKNLGLPARSEPLPTLLTAGLAYSPVRPVTLALDFNFPFSLLPSTQPAELWNIATGVDVAVTDFLSLQGGLQIKENPRLSLGSALELEKISFVVNYNLDLSGRINPLDKFSVEAKLNLGDDGRLDRQRQVEELYAGGLDAYAEGDYAKARADWEAALKLNPDFKPAIENLEMLLRRIAVQEGLAEKQNISEEE